MNLDSFHHNRPMLTPSHQLWWLRIATFLLAALAAASAAYWALKWSAAAPAGQGATPVFASASAPDAQGVVRLLGGGKAPATALPPDSLASRFKLAGVVAGRSRGGYALIAIDGKPARPYRVGSWVSEALLLQSVAPRSAALAASPNAPVAFTLELPKLAPP